MKLSQIFLTIIVIAMFCVGMSYGQTTKKSKTGIIHGQLLDYFGEGIRNAKIKIKNEKLNRKVKSDKSGNFKFELLEGIYEITIEKYGFKRYIIQGVEAKENGEKKMIIKMETGYASDDPNATFGKPCSLSSQ